MAEMTYDKPNWRHRATVPAGSSEILYLPQLRASYEDNRPPLGVQVLAAPSAGGSLLVEASISSRADIEAGNGLWEPWPPGDVAAQDSAVINPAPTALRCTATGADALWEVML